jgi:hypothetical protein
MSKWRQPGVPHKGWQCEDIEDLGAPDAVCEMCEVQEIRYVHVMSHEDYGTLRCGCICAGHMEGDRAGARQREKSFKARLSRRAKWLHREWRVSCNGNEFINTNGFNVVVYRKGTTWGARFIDKITGYKQFSQHPYASANAAKLAAFDAIAEYSESDACKSERRRQIGEMEIMGYSDSGSPVYLLRE